MHLNVSSWSSARPEQRIPIPAQGSTSGRVSTHRFRSSSPIPQDYQSSFIPIVTINPGPGAVHWRGSRVFLAHGGWDVCSPRGKFTLPARSSNHLPGGVGRRSGPDGALATHTNLYLTFQHLMKTANQGASGRSTAPAMPIPSAALAASSPAAAMAASSTPPTDA